eukprot:424924_1
MTTFFHEIINCNHKLSQCISAINVKAVLEEYSKIINDKNNSSDTQLSTKMDELINHKMLNNRYSNTKLLNDFFHIKYDHHTNDDAKQFNTFFKYLSNNEDVLSCDPTYCKGYKRYYRNRQQSVEGSNRSYAYNLLCRIHSFFMHSYETINLTGHEISYIEQQHISNNANDEQSTNDQKVAPISDASNKIHKQSPIMTNNNQSKYMTDHDREFVNYQDIIKILNENGLRIQEQFIKNAFDQHMYDKQHLIKDLCNGIGNKNDENILLAKILMHDSNYREHNKRQQFYDLILHEYINKEEMDNHSFINVLLYTIAEIYPEMKLNKIKTIARKEHLDGNIFTKGHEHFKSSIKFAKLFKSVDNWDKKQWTKIFINIKQWKRKQYSETKEQEQKLNELESPAATEAIDINYIDKRFASDEDFIDLFSIITRTDQKTGEAFLIHSKWDIDNAINKYYALSGDTSKLGPKYEHYCDDNKNKNVEITYTEGIKFWYWKPRNEEEQKCYIKNKYTHLHEEMLNTDQITKQAWINLTEECKILLNTDKIKEIKSNGKDQYLYGIKAGMSMSLQHLYAMKIYTDYTTLSKIFCTTFRLKKFGNNKMERFQSLRNRNMKFAIWAKLLIECVQSYGSLALTNKRYYRGVDKQFMFRKFVTRFHCPLSTTTKFGAAVQFAQDGLVMELKKYNNLIACFNCTLISDFDHESETLFFAGNSILQIVSVHQWYNNKWSSYTKLVKQIQNIVKIANGSISWNYQNDMKSIMSHILPDLYDNNSKLPPYIQSLLNYHLRHLPNQIEYDFEELLNAYQWIRQIFVIYDEKY